MNGSAIRLRFPRVALWPRSPTPPEPLPLGRLGSLHVRIACTSAEIDAAQALRYRVFYEEKGAIADRATRRLRRDKDGFDAACDHLIVIDRGSASTRAPMSRVVATTRLLRGDKAGPAGFYSASEFDIAPLLARKPELAVLELGRSCVHPEYRDRRTLELLWHGVWAYALAHRSDAMIGCASLDGTDVGRLALPLAFLHHFARSDADWHVAARAERHVDMNLMPREAIDAKAALRALPPLLKGYLRLGATVGDGAVVDDQFGTTDVMIVLPVAGIERRYVAHFGAGAERFAFGAPLSPNASADPRAAA